MKWEFNSRLIALLRKVSKTFALLTLAIGLAGWLSWTVDLPLLRGALPGTFTMKYNTVLCFCLAAISLLVSSPRLLVKSIGWTVGLVGAITLVQWATGANFGIDELLFKDTEASSFDWKAGRMSINTAASFLLFGLSIHFMEAKHPKYFLGQITAYCLFILSYTAIIGYLLGFVTLAGIGRIYFSSLPASTGFFCLSFALMFRYPNQGITTVITSAYAGSRQARKAFSGLFVVPLLIGSFIGFFLKTSSFQLGLDSLLLAVLAIILLNVIGSYFSFQELNHHDAERTRLLNENEEINRNLAMANEEMTALNEELRAALEEHNAMNEQIMEANREIQSLMKHKLNQSEQKFQHLTESITEMFLAIDNDSCFTYWNQVCEKLSGIDSESILGKNMYEVFPQFDGSPLERLFLAAKIDREAKNSEIKISFNGIVRDLRVHLFPSKNGISVLIEDITEQKKRENEILQLNKQLTERNHELDQIVYKISHDIRAPLTSVMGLLSLMKINTNPDETINYVNLTENRVLKLDRFIQSMLDFSRNTRTKVCIEPVNFNDLIEQCIQDLTYSKHFARMKFVTTISGDAFFSDPFRLKIVFLNLIANAIKYQHMSREQSHLQITIESNAREAVITFEDNGIGIDEQYLPQIFDMFFRATEQSDGSGLGMYIVKQTIEKLDGTVRLESTRGQGTCIRLRVPNHVRTQPVSDEVMAKAAS